jgi:hypothetical protein
MTPAPLVSVEMLFVQRERGAPPEFAPGGPGWPSHNSDLPAREDD